MSDCPICLDCLENKPIATTNCGHRFHTECLCMAVRVNVHCPMCRQQICAAQNDKKEQTELATLTLNNRNSTLEEIARIIELDERRSNNFVNVFFPSLSEQIEEWDWEDTSLRNALFQISSQRSVSRVRRAPILRTDND